MHATQPQLIQNNTFYAGWTDQIETTLRVFLLTWMFFYILMWMFFLFFLFLLLKGCNFLCIFIVFVVPLDRIIQDLVCLGYHSLEITYSVFPDRAHQCWLVTLEEAMIFHQLTMIIHKLLFKEMFGIQSNAFVFIIVLDRFSAWIVEPSLSLKLCHNHHNYGVIDNTITVRSYFLHENNWFSFVKITHIIFFWA